MTPEAIVLKGGDLGVSSFLLILYAIAAVAGGLGGCAAGCYYLTHDKRPRWAFVFAYAVLGTVFGVITFAALSAWHYDPKTVHALVIYSAIGGLAGALALATANFTVKVIFRKLGIELELTMRKRGEERRVRQAEE